MRPIDIHLVSWNRPKMTRLVIETLMRNTKPDSYRLVVFDNGSERETQNILINMHESGKIDELHLEAENQGLEYARQWMLNNATESQYFVCLDNDCLAPPMVDGEDWVEHMLDLMAKYEEFAAISMRTQVMIGTGNIFEEADEIGDDIVEFPHPGGSFRMMNRFATLEVEGWDAKRPGRGAEERFICGKLHAAGYRTAFTVKIQCLHLFGTRGDNPTDQWGYDANFKPEDTGHSDISHPALTNGDDPEEVEKYGGKENADRYNS